MLDAGDLSRFIDDSPYGHIVYTNDTLVCKDCQYRYDIVGSCKKYETRKPEGILNNTALCPYYRQGEPNP